MRPRAPPPPHPKKQRHAPAASGGPARPPLPAHPATPGAQVSYVRGWGKFKSATEVEVALADGGSQTISAKNVIIATGSEVATLPGVTIDEEK